MKLQHLSVIFIIIMIPLILVYSYYLKMQKECLAIRTEYDKKLTTSVQEAMKSYEINTTEYNYYDDRIVWEDSEDGKINQREAILASVNTFITSIANNLGISRSKQRNNL